MTIIFSGVSSNFITMTVDSAIRNDFKDGCEYEKDYKMYCFPNVGYVATWGARTGNNINEYLNKNISSANHSINDLANFVEKYLKEEYQPAENKLGSVGYHVAGFDRDKIAQLYHIFYGPSQDELSNYSKNIETPSPQEIKLLYNGRNDIACIIVNTLLEQINKNNESRFDIRTPLGLTLLGDFIVRFVAEITKDVGPPFYTYMISTSNTCEIIKNDSFCPINHETVRKKLSKLNLLHENH